MPDRAARRALLTAVAVAVALPATAHAGDVSFSRDGSQLFYTANSGPERNDVTVRANNATEIFISDSAVVGLPGDRENVAPNFETVIGSDHADAPLFGTPGPDTMLGLGGNDAIAGGGGGDVFIASSERDGADDYHGGPGHDTINYGSRTQRLVIDQDNLADDGETGEADNVRANIESVLGGSAADIITGDAGFDVISGGPGDDRLKCGGGDDLFMAGKAADGADRVDGGSGADTMFYGERTLAIKATPDAGGANDGESGERDELPATERIAGGSAGDEIRAPQGSGWKRLGKIQVRLSSTGAPVGTITIHPRAERVSAAGEVTLARRATRLAHKGKTVTAHLSVRLGESLAGQRLTAEVEATDTRGHRQIERDAGIVKVAA